MQITKSDAEPIVTIAKLSPNFSFSWAELVFSLDLPHPHTTRESIRMVNKHYTLQNKFDPIDE